MEIAICSSYGIEDSDSEDRGGFANTSSKVRKFFPGYINSLDYWRERVG